MKYTAHRAFKYSAFLLLLNWFDTFATMYSLDKGAEETNPVALWVIENLGFTGLFLIKTFLLIPLFVPAFMKTFENSDLCFVLLKFATVVYSLLAMWHIFVFIQLSH